MGHKEKSMMHAVHVHTAVCQKASANLPDSEKIKPVTLAVLSSYSCLKVSGS